MAAALLMVLWQLSTMANERPPADGDTSVTHGRIETGRRARIVIKLIVLTLSFASEATRDS
jgi:hypothetical protein